MIILVLFLALCDIYQLQQKLIERYLYEDDKVTAVSLIQIFDIVGWKTKTPYVLT